MARRRLAVAQRKLAAQREQRWQDAAAAIGHGVVMTTREVERVAHPLPLFVRGPVQFVVEQMASRLVDVRDDLADADRDELAAYLLAGALEFLVGLFGDLDREHFEAWRGALAHGERESL